MAVDIEELIIAPIREVVDRGKEAVANAESADDRDDDADDTAKRMAKAGKALVREGERALKRLQPLWDDQVKKYGDAFRTAMDKNVEIEERRRTLDGLVYDFEDYIEIDTFDEDRFTELQAAVKSLALHVLDIIKKLNLDGVPVNPPPTTVSVFPPLPPLPPLPPSVFRQGAAKSPSRSPTLNHMSKPPSRSRDAVPQGTEHSSRPQRESGTLGSVTTSSMDGRRRRPTPQGVLRRDTTTSHASSHYSVDTLPSYSSEEARPVGAQQAHPTDRTPGAHMHRSAPPARSTPDVLGPQNSHMRTENDPFSPAATEPLEIPVFPISRTTKWVTEQAAVPASPRLSRPLTIRESMIPEDRAVTTNSPTLSTATPRLNHIDRPRSPVQPPDGLIPSPTLGAGPPSIPPLSLPSAAAEIESGLMVSEDWKTVVSDGANSGSRALLSVSSREPECCIGPKSSLYQMNGFCRGAQAFKQGGHLQAVKRVQGYVAGSTTYTGKCISCGYAHQYDELEMDVNGDPNANFTSSNVRFRVRFLYKSHLATTRSPEAYYGCLFCAHAGSVVREGDATVFATSDALFRHLARHPQPLPAVPDVTVLYGGGGGGGSDAQDFDVHFLEPPPTESVETDGNSTTQNLPVATATRMHLQRYGEKKLPRPEGLSEKRELLQFFAGATVVGVEFPAAWAGKWATGWHDGRWGFFPAKCVELERPRRRSEMPPLLSQQTTSGGGIAVTRSVVARWKWEPSKDAAEKGWLVFDKGETITHVGWVERERWCWSGVNKKGQAGVFPRSHVRWDQVKEEVASPSPVARPVTSRGLTKRGFFGRSKSSAAVTASSASSMSGGSSVIEIVI